MTIEKLQSYTKKLNVLYVEDSATWRQITLGMLDGLFKHLDVAKDGVEALELFSRFYEKTDTFYDIVITDLEMPNMDGKELAKRLFDFHGSQEVMVISSVDNMDRVVELVNLGITKFIKKPIEEEQLFGVLFDVANKLRIRRLEAEEQAEIEESNWILTKREKDHINQLENTVQELSEFKKALDESAIVSKTDIDGTITYVNELFCRISGYSKDELIGQNHRILKSGKMDEKVYRNLWDTLTTKKIFKGVFTNRNKKGDLYYIKTTIKPILDLHGDIVEYISVAYDMTRLKKTMDSERQALKSKANFFINISHEMRTPLNAILGFSSVLRNLVKADKKVAEIVDAIFESSNELHQLIESILLIRKLNDHKLTLTEHLFNPLTELEKSIVRFTPKAQAKELSLLSSFDPNLPTTLSGDAPLMVIALNALIDNAIKFTPQKGVVELNVIYDDSSDTLIIQVSDNGIGIAKNDQEKIFKLEQIDGSFTRAFEGAGLGLTIASGIVHLMKGKISVDSEVNEGTIFTMELPFTVEQQI